MLLCAVIAFLSGWAGHWLGSRKRSIVRVPETVVRHDTIRPAIPEAEVIVREVPTEVDTAAILADYFSEKHYLDTIIERPYLKVELTDVISHNSLLDRTVVVDYRQPIVCNNALVVGMDAGLITDIDFTHTKMGNQRVNVNLTFCPASRKHQVFDRYSFGGGIFDYTFDRTFE